MLAAIDSTSYFRVSLMGVISARRLDLPGKGLDNGKAIQVACLNTRGSSEQATQVPFGRDEHAAVTNSRYPRYNHPLLSSEFPRGPLSLQPSTLPTPSLFSFSNLYRSLIDCTKSQCKSSLRFFCFLFVVVACLAPACFIGTATWLPQCAIPLHARHTRRGLSPCVKLLYFERAWLRLGSGHQCDLITFIATLCQPATCPSKLRF